MYLYFDRNGILKEFINDEPLRQGNVGVNKVYFYIEGKDIEDFTSVDTDYLLNNASLVKKQDISLDYITTKIPYNKERDLRFFNYYTDYEFAYFDIPSDVLQVPGATSCSISYIVGQTSYTLDLFTFMINESVIGSNYVASEEYVSLSQFKQLLIRVANTVANIPDASRTKKGLMSASDFEKLEHIEDEATKNIVSQSIVEDDEDAVSGGAVYTAIAGISEDINDINTSITSLSNNKVNKVNGKELSTNDFTNDYKNKLDNLGFELFGEWRVDDDDEDENKITFIEGKTQLEAGTYAIVFKERSSANDHFASGFGFVNEYGSGEFDASKGDDVVYIKFNNFGTNRLAFNTGAIGGHATFKIYKVKGI